MLIQSNCKPVKRVWEGKVFSSLNYYLIKDINVSVFTYPHENGVVILYLNYTDDVYEENVVFSLTNLFIVNKNEENTLRFLL